MREWLDRKKSIESNVWQLNIDELGFQNSQDRLGFTYPLLMLSGSLNPSPFLSGYKLLISQSCSWLPSYSHVSCFSQQPSYSNMSCFRQQPSYSTSVVCLVYNSLLNLYLTFSIFTSFSQSLPHFSQSTFFPCSQYMYCFFPQVINIFFSLPLSFLFGLNCLRRKLLATTKNCSFFLSFYYFNKILRRKTLLW